MNVTSTPLEGAYIVDISPSQDERGFFARTFCMDVFSSYGLSTHFAQCSVSFNAVRGTLRGMHFQAPPQEEDKLVRCTAGTIYDVIADVRPHSPTYAKWFGIELSAQNRRALMIPKGFAHGFLSLEDDTEVFYMISAPYVAAAARGFRWNDPAVGIEWPLKPSVISDRDSNLPLLAALSSQ